MEKIVCINGWTKEKVLAQVKRNFIGVSKVPGVGNGCAYLDAQGRKCLVGCFIPSNRPAARRFPGGVGDLLEHFPTLTKLMPFDFDGLSRMQSFHDGELKSQYADPNEQKAHALQWIKDNVQ